MAAALVAWVAGCATPPPPGPGEAQAVRAHVSAGLDFYEAGDYVLAAERFHAAAAGARRYGDPAMQAHAVTAECASWLRARHVDEFASCTARLDALQRSRSRSDPGVNTLIALGAVAGGRPLPPYKIPNTVRPLIQATAQESQ